MAPATHELVGEVVARRLSEVLEDSGVGTLLRVNGFGSDECREIAMRLHAQLCGDSGGVVVLVGATEPIPGMDDSLRLPRDRTPTSYRNDASVQKLVYLELRQFSDQQSLKHFTSFTDRSVLGAEVDAQEAKSRRQSVLRLVWDAVGSTLPTPPSSLLDALELVYERLRRNDPPALRAWIAFVAEASETLARSRRAVDDSAVLTAVGNALPHLELLPDPGLARVPPTQRSDRIDANIFAHDRRDPKGRSVEAEDIAGLASRTQFSDGDQQPLSDEASAGVREDISRFMEAVYERPRVSLHHWLQMFERDRRRGLGTRILDFLATDANEHLQTYEDLRVTDPLDANNVDAARKLLDDGPEIVASLPPKLRRAVERLAEPRSPAVVDPLRHLLSIIYAFVADADEDGQFSLRLERAPRRGTDGESSLALFAFMYGPTLAAINRDGQSATRIRLAVTDELTQQHPLRKIDADDEEEDPQDDSEWDPLVLRLFDEINQEEVKRFEWRPLEQPGLVLFHVLFSQSTFDHWRVAGQGFPEWTASTLRATAPSGGRKTSEGGGVVTRWLDLRLDTLQRISGQGLDPAVMLDYTDGWNGLLSELQRLHVPTGAPEPEIGRFLRIDTWCATGSDWVLLATHPLRLRWIARHLHRLGELLGKAMDGELELNPVNDGFFFDRLRQLSPHEQPAVLATGEELHIAVREEDWHEHFAVLLTSSTTETGWLADLDDGSVDELSRIVAEYVEAHPHKEDGVSVLMLVREKGARVLGRFLAGVLGGKRAPGEITLHVFAPRSEFSDIERAVALVDRAETRLERTFPQMTVALHEWADSASEMPSLAGFDELVDLAIVPNLFGRHTRALQRTRNSRPGDAAFEVWMDPATFVEASGDAGALGQNVSRVLIPQRYDPVLWHWSTVNVRGFRNQAVGPGTDGDEVDFVALQVRFDQSRELYETLHRVAQWVVTLDPFVGRDQIEALPQRPEVILVRPRVGKSSAYTLVVSSSTGRKFVVDRLQARLVNDLPEDMRSHAPDIASRLYEVGRQLTPGLVLRALGLGWAVQELIGLVVARRLADEFVPVPRGEGFTAWLSLDDHASWFGRAQRTRADLVRLAMVHSEQSWNLHVLVVEAKMRDQAAIGVAEQQVRNTVDLLTGALQLDSNRRLVDCEFWRAEVLQAIEQLPRGGSESASPAFSSVGPGETPENRLTDGAREAFRKGEYSLASVDGFICFVQRGLSATEVTRSALGYELIRVDPVEAGRVLYAVARGEDVRPRTNRRGVSSGSSGPGGTSEHPPSVEPRSEPEASPVAPSASPGPVQRETAPSRGDAPSATVDTRPGHARTPAPRIDEVALEARYQQVIDVFSEFKVQVSRPEEDAVGEGPGFYVFRVRPGHGVRPDAVRKYVDDIKLKLELPAEAQIRSYLDTGCIVFEVPKRDEERYFVDAENLWARTTFDATRLYAPLGENIRGDVVGIDFSSSDSPHLLVAGQTGSGKSIALETLLLGLVRHYSNHQLELALVDPKGTELVALEESPHLLAPIAIESSEAIQFLDEAVAEMQRRRELFRAVRARDLPQYNERVADRPDLAALPWRMIVLDEYADLVSDKDDKKRIEGFLQRLSQKARASGIHIVVATQRPSADVISSVVRANLPAQLALRVRSAIESNVVMAEAGAETLAGKGDGFLKTARGTVRIQCGRVEQ